MPKCALWLGLGLPPCLCCVRWVLVRHEVRTGVYAELNFLPFDAFVVSLAPFLRKLWRNPIKRQMYYRPGHYLDKYVFLNFWKIVMCVIVPLDSRFFFNWQPTNTVRLYLSFRGQKKFSQVLTVLTISRFQKKWSDFFVFGVGLRFTTKKGLAS